RRMRRVARLDLQHAQLALDGGRARCFEQRGARTTSSCCGTDVQVVDEASASAILHAEGDGEYDMADGRPRLMREPHPSHRGLGEQRFEGACCCVCGKGNLRFRIEVGHERYESWNVRGGSGSDLEKHDV